MQKKKKFSLGHTDMNILLFRIHISLDGLMIPWWFLACRTEEGDGRRNPSSVAHSCFSFHSPGRLTSPKTLRCFQIKYRLMNQNPPPPSTPSHTPPATPPCLLVCLRKMHVGRRVGGWGWVGGGGGGVLESPKMKMKNNNNNKKRDIFTFAVLWLQHPACGVVRRVFVNCISLQL